MRIAFVPAARVLSETEPNGEALIAVSLLKGLAARGHDVLAYCERSDLAPVSGLEVREVSAEGATTGLSRLAFARRIARDAAREEFDVAHILFPFNTREGYTLVRGAPVVAGPINLPWPGEAARRPRALARLASRVTGPAERRHHRRTLARASRLLVTGASSEAAIPASLRDRASHVPFGVDTARFRPAPLPDDPTITFFSVLQARKGIEVLVRAMPAVAQRVPRARLLVAGADPDGMRPGLERLARELGVADVIRFSGAVSPRESARVYAKSTLLCQPSLGEPFGMTVLEAMASGRPVVGTAAGGIPDAIVHGEGGRLVPAGDAGLLADALCQVLEQPREAAAMGAFNRARVERTYALDRVLDAIETVYNEVAGRPVREATHAA